MKSLSLDSPESTELHARGRRHLPSGPSGYHGGSGGHLEHSTPPSNNSRLHCKNFSKVANSLFYSIHSFYILKLHRVHQLKENYYMQIVV